MNEKTINEQYAYIRALLEEKRLKEALMQLESLLWQCPDWDLRTRLEQLQTSYKYMLEYMKQGANDPERWNLYQKMVSDTWGIADQSRLLILDNASSRYYHEVRRTPKSPDLSNYGLKTILHILESFNDDLAVSGLLSDEKMDEVLKRHEDTLKFMFIRTWTNSAWTPEDEEDAKAMLASELLPGDDLCLFVSALTLSLMECFDLRKIMWLLDAYEHPNVNVSQRALVGAMIIFHIYRSRLTFYPELIKRVDLMEEIPSFREDVARIYRQMLLCQETEKIDKKMREEIIPEMLKNVSSMKNMRFGFEESDEENNDMNPDWEDAFEKSGLGDKLREMNELQLEGADVYMSTFAALKNYPFFREVHNWFYPFSKQQSNVLKAMKQAGSASHEQHNNTDLHFIVTEDLAKRLDVSPERAERILSMTRRGSASHAAWLTFMLPRLSFARDLLTDDGVIFISIDDNEQANLKRLCDEVFGEECFVAQFIWEKRKTRENRSSISVRQPVE